MSRYILATLGVIGLGPGGHRAPRTVPLASNPEVWSKTALFITYDENDGYFDHVVPPFPAANAAQGKSTVSVSEEMFGSITSPSAPASSGAGPYGLGVRVPMFVLSPWSKGGRVCSEVFDHTSILRFMERRFGVREPNISPWRRTVVGDLTSAFDVSKPSSRCPRFPAPRRTCRRTTTGTTTSRWCPRRPARRCPSRSADSVW